MRNGGIDMSYYENKPQKRIISIKMKLVGTVIPLMAISIISILFINFFSTKSILIESTNERLVKESNVNVKNIESWVGGILSSLNVVQTTLQTVTFPNDHARLNYLKTTCEMNEGFPKGVHLADENNYWLDPSGYKPGSKYIVKNQEWYKEGLAHETFSFGKPYFESSIGNTGAYVVSATAKLKGQQTQMVATATVELERITDMVADIKVMETGYCFLLDSSNNKIIAHYDPSWNASTIFESDTNPLMAHVAKLVRQKDYSIHTVDTGNETYFVKLEEVPYTTWILVSLVTESSVLTELNRLEILYLVMGILAIMISAFIVWHVITRTIHPIQGLTHALSEITDGNFSIQIEAQGKDEIAVMSMALKEFIDVMKKIIGDINQISDKLKMQAESGESVSHTLATSANQQSDAMIKMRAILKQLADSINEITECAATLAQVVEHTTQSGILAKDKIKDTVEMAGKSHEDMKEVQQIVGMIIETINELQKTVVSVGASTKEINSIINVMGHIASETKLLSLNAAIEAARAGEVGKGFAVVAHGIGELAVSSSKAAIKANEMIKKINVQITHMIAQTKESTLYIENNVIKVEGACKTFETIYHNVTEASQVINDMMTEMHQVDQVAISMAAITQEQVANAQDIMEHVDALTTHSQRVTEDSKVVAQTGAVISEAAKTLYQDMRRFQI